MSRYLIVMHQTALRRGLQRTVRALVTEDPVPLTWEGETVDVARQRAEAAKTLLEETAQARVFRTSVGAPEPLQAITDELHTQPGYDTLVICTLPPGASRWLKLDLMHRAERKFGLRVMHVVAEAPAPARP